MSIYFLKKPLTLFAYPCIVKLQIDQRNQNDRDCLYHKISCILLDFSTLIRRDKDPSAAMVAFGSKYKMTVTFGVLRTGMVTNGKRYPVICSMHF